ncbi:hypothetical protein J7K86_00855 [bacterium]|nr:hypothetical protein [bacterium]
MSEKLNKDSERVLISKQKLIIVGLIIVLFNPLFAGLIYGLALWREKSLSAEGKMIVLFSLLWGAIVLALARRLGTFAP